MLRPDQCGVIFDFDGVIVDSSEAHFLSFVILGEEEGYRITRDQFQEMFGKHNSDILPSFIGRKLLPAELDRLSERKEAIFRDIVRGKVTALPGVTVLLQGLRDAGFHLAIGTSTPMENVMQILDELQLSSYFEAMATAADVTRGKPDPEVFIISAARLGIIPERCIVVEDAVVGIQAALNGGMKALGVTTNHSRQSLRLAHRVVDSLEEVTVGDIMRLLENV